MLRLEHRRGEAVGAMIATPFRQPARSALSSGAALPGSGPARHAAPFLRFDGVTIRLGGREILSPTSFDVARGEFVCIVGPSGCGKTTLLRAASGLVAASAGEVRRNGVKMTRALARSGFRVPGLRPRAAALAHGRGQREPRARGRRRARGRARAAHRRRARQGRAREACAQVSGAALGRHAAARRSRAASRRSPS